MYQQTVIEQQISPPSNLITACNRFLMSVYDEVGQNVNLTNIPERQESKIEIISILGSDGMGSNIHKRKVDN